VFFLRQTILFSLGNVPTEQTKSNALLGGQEEKQ